MLNTVIEEATDEIANYIEDTYGVEANRYDIANILSFVFIPVMRDLADGRPLEVA